MRPATIDTTRATTTLRRRPSTSPRGDGFARHLSVPASADAAAEPATSEVLGLGALLALQEVDGNDDGRARGQAIRHGHDILDRLELLRLDLLAGVIPADRLTHLLQSVRSRPPHVSDPRLKALLDEIELRAVVELAKLEHPHPA